MDLLQRHFPRATAPASLPVGVQALLPLAAMALATALVLAGQAPTFAPLVLALLIQRRLPRNAWPMLAAVPAALLIADPRWTTLDPWLLHNLPLSRGAPNIWSVVAALPVLPDLPLTGLAIAASIGAGAAIAARLSVRPMRGIALLGPALLCALVMPGILPAARPGDFVPAALLAIAAAYATPSRRTQTVAMLVLTGFALAMGGTVAGLGWPAAIGAAPMLTATWRTLRQLIKPAANDNPLLARNG